MTQPTLQIGKRYLRRDKVITGPIKRNPNDKSNYPFIDPLNDEIYYEDGHWQEQRQVHDLDLIQEAEEIISMEEYDVVGDCYDLVVKTVNKRYEGCPLKTQKPIDYIKQMWSHLYLPEPELTPVDKELGERFLTAGVDTSPRETILAQGGTEFSTGAVRSSDAAGVRYDLITPIGLRRIAETYKEGYDKYGAFNWEKGMPINDILNHGIRHIFEYLSGDRSEDHLAHAAWNLLAAMHMEETHPNLTTELRPKK